MTAAAYRHATRMTNEQTGETRDYSGKKPELVHAEITLPEDAPAWAAMRYSGEDVDAASMQLWNDVEIREDQHNRRATAQLAYSYTFALPAELSHKQNIALVRDFVQTSLVTSGAVVDWVIHDKGDGNPHAHVMTTQRTLGENGLDQKIRTYVDRRQDIVNLRFNWACAANTALETAGFEARIDHRRLDVQGIKLGAISFNSEIAANIEQGDAAYRVKQRVIEARLENETYLMEHPEHMLTVVAASNPLFTEADLERGFQQYLPTSVGRDGIEGLMGLAMASDDLVRLDSKSSWGEYFLTTRAVVEMNRQMERDALSLAQSRLALGDGHGYEALPDTLSNEQRMAVRSMVSSRRLTLVTGFAGAGKTFAIKEAAKVWAVRGFEVLGGAISGKATQELSGIEGEVATLAQWEAKWDRGERPAQGRFVFVMDEAGMVGTAIWSRMQARIKAMGGKLIGVGDKAQLAPIQDTAAFKHLTKLVGQVTIGEVRRQDDPGDRRATEMLSRGGAEAALAIDHYARKGAIRFEENLGKAIDALSKAYFEHEGMDRIALTHLNADVDALNAAIRIEALARGAVDHKSQVSYARGAGADTLVLGIGDRVRFTRPYREASVTKSSFASVIAASETQLILSVDGQSGVVMVDPRVFLHFDYGYAATVHKSQGMTVANNVEVLVTSQFDAHLLDVSLSRHKQTVRMWVPEDSVEGLADIKEMVQRSSLIDVVRGGENDAAVLGRMARDISDVTVGARVDRIAADPQKHGHVPHGHVLRVIVTGLAGDAHLTQQGMRMAGLLRAEYEPGQPDLADDPRGLAIDPLKAVDDLLAEQGVFKAADVAARLGEVVRAPDLFMRLFAQAMSHPDLVVLSEEGLRGEGRVYSSTAHIAQVAGLMDRGVTLAVSHGFEAVEASLVDASAQNASLGHVGRAGLDYALWPSRIGILEEIGTSETARVTQALGEIAQQTGAQVIVVSADARAATRFAATATAAPTAGIEGMGLYAFGNRLRQGSLSLRAGDILVVPEASGLHVDDLDLLTGFAEESGAKLLLHSDPSLDATGSVLRHLSARVEISVLGGFEALAEDRRGLLTGGQALEAAYKELWNKDVFIGSSSDELQVDGYVVGFIADETVDKLGVASSARMRDALNIRIEAELQEKKGVSRDQIHRIDRGEAPVLSVHEGTVLVLRRDVVEHGLTAGARGVVRSVDDAGQVTVRFVKGRFEAQDVTFAPGAQATGLDYGTVLTAREARGLHTDSLHGFAGRGLRRPDLIAMLGSADKFSLSLPVNPDLEGEGVGFLSRALAREGRASVLDYGFDPIRALAAAADTVQVRPAEPALDLSADDLAVRADTAAHFKAQPAFIVSALVRENSRFDHGQLQRHVQKLFPAVEYPGMDHPAFDHKAFTDQVLSETVAQGSLITAGFSRFDGARLYTTRVQAEIEARGLAQGKALARSKLAGIGQGIDGQDMVDLRSDVAHVTGAARLSLATVDPGPQRDGFLQQAGAVWRARGYQVIATGTSGYFAKAAAERLGDTVQHASLASLEAQWAMGRLPEEKFVVVMDGADRVQSLQWMRVQARVTEMGGKLIAVGHSSGLSPIGSVSLHRLLAREVGVEQRDRIAHQTREDERIATSYLAEPGVPAAHALDIYHNKGAVRFAGRAEGAQAAIARAYWANDYRQEVEKGSEVRLAMAHARVMAGTLDAAIRAEGQRLGRFGDGETCWGRQINIGEVLEAKSDIALAGVKAGDRGRVVRLGPESIELDMPSHFEPVEIYSASRMAEFKSSIATTIHAAEAQVVDRSYLYASRGMDQEMFRAGMTRHQQSLELHVPETAFRDYAALQKAVQRNSDLEMLADVSSEDVSRDAVSAPDISGRADRTGAALWSGGDFGFDAHLQATASRIAGLLSIDYKPGAPVLGNDPRGYASDPLKLVDDLLAERSVIRAADVARSLSGVVRDPDSFVRLFAEAMAHPDLVVLSEEGLRGEGRVYATLAHIRRELDLVDRVSALALAQSDIRPAPARIEAAARTDHGAMSPDQERALRHAVSPARIAMTSGLAGSGKSSVLKGVREVYEREGWTVVGAALAGKAAQGLQEASGIQSYTLAALGFAAAQERVTLGPKSLLVVDEAGMLNADHFEMVLELVERTGASLRLVGDPRQLQPRGPGAMWRAFADRIGTVDLTTVWRQHDPLDRAATRNLAAGGAGADLAIDHFLDKGTVQATGRDRDALFTKAVAGYSADPHEDKMLLTYRLADVAHLNRLARADDQAKRADALPCIAVSRADGDVLELQAGDRIAFRENRRASGIVNGMTGEIAAVNLESQSFTVRIGGYEDEARYVSFRAEDSPELDYGYAITLHKSQGDGQESSHLVVTAGFDHSLFNVGATRYRSALAIYVPVEEDKAGEYLKTIARRDMVPTTTLEAEYGFDPAMGFEAARQAKVQDRAEVRAEDGDLGAYVARHTGTQRSVPMPLGPLSRLFAPMPERETLAVGADTRALADVIGAHILGHGAQMEAEVQARAMRLLQDVSTAKTWSRICKTLPRDLPARAETVALRWTNSTSGDALLPEARAFGRAIAVADRRGDSSVARALKSGLELLSARVGQARREGSYDQMLKAVNSPAPADDPASELASQDLLPLAQPIEAREWRGKTQRSPAPARSGTAWLGGAPSGGIGELAVARQVIGSLSSKGPGFWETLLSDYGDHRKDQAAGFASPGQGGTQSKKDKVMKQSVEMKPGFDLAALTPITEDHQKVLARALNPDANRKLTDGIQLADYAAQIGAGTVKFADLQKTATAFRQLATQAGSIGPCDPSVPGAWKARLLQAVTSGAAFETMPKLKSVEEWTWALSHSVRIGALATGPEDLTRTQAGEVPTWADHLFTRMISDMGHRRPGKSNSERMDWNINLRSYVSQVTYVPSKDTTSAALALAKSDPVVIKEKLAGEQVPQDWKDKLTERLANRNDYSKHPLFGSLGEFEWAISTMVKKGAEVSTGRTPTPNDLVKAALEEKGPGMSMRPF